MGKTKAHLKEENEILRSRVQELEELLKQSESYLAEIIHDLRSPTIAIRGLARSLAKRYENPDGPKARIAAQIASISGSLEQLVEDLNRFLHTKLAPLKIEDFDTQDIIDVLKEEFLPRLQSRNIELVEPEKNFRIRASKTELTRALKNYILNALNYGGNDLSQIAIACLEEPDCYLFSVHNDGEKISEHDCKKIFRRFERCKRHQEITGSGLGLAIVEEIAKRHKGEAWAKTEKEGMTFFISISKSL